MKLFISLLTLILMGCGSNSSTAPEKPYIPLKKSFECKTTKDNPYECVQKACVQAQGTFNASSNECECSDNGIFDANKAQCVSKKLAMSCLVDFVSSEECKSVDITSFNTYYFKNSPDQNITQSFDIEKENIPFSFFTYPHKVLMEIWIGKENLPKQPRSQNGNDLSFVKLPYYNLTTYDETSFLIFNLLYFDNQKEFISQLKNSSEEKITSVIQNPTHKQYIELLNTFAKNNKNLSYVLKESDFEDKCLSYCLMEAERSEVKPGYYIQSAKIVLGGKHFMQYLTLQNTHKKVLAVARYFNKSINVFGILDHETKTGLTKGVDAYSSSGDHILYEQFLRQDKIDQLVQFPEKLKSEKNDGLILLCDTHIDITDEKFADYIYKGPGDTDVSLFGWNFSPSNSNSLFSELLEVDGWLFPDLFTNTKHFNKTAEILLHESDYKIIPSSALGCEINSELINTLSKQNKIKVGSYNVMKVLSKDDCTDFLNTNSLFNDDLMWVFPAGNLNIDLSQVDKMCPQTNLSQKDHVILVGAVENEQMAPYSNYSWEQVDVFAQGKTLNEDSRGTSYAGPRVARLAMDITTQFPNLSHRQIKHAILIGVKRINENLPSRASGEIYPEYALGVAQLLDQGLSEEQALLQYYKSIGESRYSIQKRLYILNKNILKK